MISFEKFKTKFPPTFLHFFLGTTTSAILFVVIVPLVFPPLTPVISLTDGSIQGRVEFSRNGHQYWQFLSIPYALPPTGKRRYSPPLKAHPWSGVRRTTRYPPFCLQFDAIITQTVYGEEDCLYLNVFTHPVRNNKKVPVLVHIHGGGFLMGGSRMFGPDYFMDHDIVVVTFNYRLGPLGFLNFNEPGLPRGNMGMKDQVMVLQWVQNNIEKFGGDPDRVTIFGDSAGGVSVNLHILSPKSQGLFHRAISQSGSAFAPWGFTKKPRETAYKYANRLNCPVGNTSDLMECLENYDPAKLVIHQLACTDPFIEKDNLSPSVEEMNEEDAFLTEDPSLLLEGDFRTVPYLIGVTSGDGALRTARFDAIPSNVNTLQSNWIELLGKVLLFDHLPAGSALDIKDHFFSSNISYEDPQQFKDTLSIMFSDLMAYLPATRSAQGHASQGGSSYLYYYNYKPVFFPGVYSLFKACTPNDIISCDFKILLTIITDWVEEHIFGMGGSHQYAISHAEEEVQLWNLNGISKYFSWMERNFSEQFVQLFVDFIKDEDLLYKNVRWTPVERNMTQMLLVDDSPTGRLITPPYEKRLRFWDRLQM